MIGIADIESAARRIDGKVRHTPVLAADQAKAPLPVERVTLKLECLQVSGSFKARGAINRVLATPREAIAKGIVTASGGNHGLAIARTSFAAGVPAAIYVPTGVSMPKVEKMRAWGARVEIVGDVWDISNAAALDFAAKTGAQYVHPFADPLVVAGQGTLGLEILDDIPDVGTVVIAIGGGGLISGLGTAIRTRKPSVRIVGVEPTGSPTLKASLDAGHVVTLPEITSRVPTMSCRATDPRNFAIVQKVVDDIVLVSDEEMAEASRWLWFEMGVAADLAGAASVAALRRSPASMSGHVCALICGAGSEGAA